MQECELFMDVSGDLMPEFVANGQMHTVPMEFIIEGRPQMYDYFNSDFDIVNFYNEIKKKVDIKTTQITPELYESYFEPYIKQGKSVLYLCLSTGLSCTYQSACSASASLKQKYPNVDLLVINSLAATSGMGVIAERMIENKANGLSVQENFDDIQSIKGRVSTLGVIGDLVMLKRGGRISAATALIGGILDIKPIIEIVKKDGTLNMQSKQKGMKRSLKYLLDYYTDHRDSNSDILYLVHSNEENYANELEEMIVEKYPEVKIRRRMLSPIIGAHLGSGSVVLSFYDNENNSKK